MNYSVTILMSTYNGEKYINEQLKSLFNQKDVQVNLFIRDDGSNDNTIKIIETWKENYPIELICGSNLGYAKSFMTLISIVSKNKSNFFAFCDQDDVWEPEKLITAIKALDFEQNMPALYLSQVKIVDSELKPLEALFHSRKVELGAVLEHNYAIGCTMVFNESLRKILDINIDNMLLDCGHDSWVYLVALAVGAVVNFDKNGYVLYRQHGNNASGKIVSLRQTFRAINKLLFKWKYARSKTAEKLILNYSDNLSPDNFELLKKASGQKRTFGEKKNLVFDKRFYSDYLMVDILFAIAVYFNLF